MFIFYAECIITYAKLQNNERKGKFICTFPSASNFSERKVTKKREKNKIIYDLLLRYERLPSLIIEEYPNLRNISLWFVKYFRI